VELVTRAGQTLDNWHGLRLYTTEPGEPYERTNEQWVW
jgi:hypothetical protein